MRVGEEGGEGAWTGRDNDDGVGVARWIVCRPYEPVMAHDLVVRTIAKVQDDRVADNIAL